MSGYSFKLSGGGAQPYCSAWLEAGDVFATPEFKRRYSMVELSLLTPKVALVPEAFLSPGQAREALQEVCSLREGDYVESVPVPSQGAVLVFSNSLDEQLSKVLSQLVLPISGEPVRVLPELYWQLQELESISEYNKIVLSWRDGWLHLVIALGNHLALANVFEAPDFTTAQYYLFLALKRLQLNPEVSTVHLRTPLDQDSELSLYRYFKSVVRL